jgi:hypothetical protein
MEIWPDARVKTLFSLHNRLEPSQLPELQDEVVRKSLLSEAIALAGRSPDEAAKTISLPFNPPTEGSRG